MWQYQPYCQVLPMERPCGACRSQRWRKNPTRTVKTLVHQDKNRSQLWDAELDQALTDISTTMHTITLQESDVAAQLGPTLTSEIQFEGCPVKALLDTGSPSTIVSLEFLLEMLAKQKKPEETPTGVAGEG